MSGFRHISDDVVHSGHVISLSNSRFEAPDGTAFEREIVRHPGAVSIVPLRSDGLVVLVRQYRAALDEMVLEIPAGKRDVAGEDIKAAALRELAEEVGLLAKRLDLLARFHNSVGFSDEESFVFLGRDLEIVDQDRQGIEETFMEIVEVPLDHTPAMIAAGEITDAKTIIGLTFARNLVAAQRSK